MKHWKHWMMSTFTEQEQVYKNIAVAGAGASGAFLTLLLGKNPYNNVFLFDEKPPFSTLLPTGGGRCNLTFEQKDVREFVKNYPRGDKFLLSVLSRFGVDRTRRLFNDLGIKTYVQEDNRVFPSSNSSVDVIKKLSSHLKGQNIHIIRENVVSVYKKTDGFELGTKHSSYIFDKVVIATGGKGGGFKLAKSSGHKIVELKPSLTALDIKEKDFYSLSGLTFKSVSAKAIYNKNKYFAEGDMLFTHKSISGPLIFKISALSAYDEYSTENPLEISFRLTNVPPEQVESEIKNNSKKTIKNIFSKFAPEKFISVILSVSNIDANKQAAQIKKSEKEILMNALFDFKVHAVKRIKDSEIVTAGGVDLKEINPKTMESKITPGLYFTGEVLNIDGFTGGFNLQNCWSTAYICSVSI